MKSVGKSVTVFAKCSIIDVPEGSDYDFFMRIFFFYLPSKTFSPMTTKIEKKYYRYL